MQHSLWQQRCITIEETGVALNMEGLESRQASWMTDCTCARTHTQARTHAHARMPSQLVGRAEQGRRCPHPRPLFPGPAPDRAPVGRDEGGRGPSCSTCSAQAVRRAVQHRGGESRSGYLDLPENMSCRRLCCPKGFSCAWSVFLEPTSLVYTVHTDNH